MDSNYGDFKYDQPIGQGFHTGRTEGGLKAQRIRHGAPGLVKNKSSVAEEVPSSMVAPEGEARQFLEPPPVVSEDAAVVGDGGGEMGHTTDERDEKCWTTEVCPTSVDRYLQRQLFLIKLGWDATFSCKTLDSATSKGFNLWFWQEVPEDHYEDANPKLIQAIEQSLSMSGEGDEVELAKEINLSYQELGDKYQYAYFKSVAKCETFRNLLAMDLSHNDLFKLQDVAFPSLRKLSLANNRISSFLDLPDLPSLIDLNLRKNNLLSAEHCAKYSLLERLCLQDNPIEYKPTYLDRIEARAPLTLKFLDGRALSDYMNDDGEPRSIQPYSGALLIKLAFQQEDGDRF